MKSRYRMTAILFLLLIGVCFCCEVDDVAVYKVEMKTLWDDDTFPNYPTDSKKMWSQVFGQSHNKSYALYHVGDVARPFVKDFAQFGTADHLMEEGEEDPKVYDQFTAPSIEDGRGETEGMVFVNGGHSLISLINRMVPSPDWFVGVDSFDLCVDSSWVEEVTLDLEPLDAGITSNIDVPLSVEKVSHRNSDFPGTSFYHRKTRHMTPIAKVDFKRVKEYSIKELNDLVRKELISNMKPSVVRKNIIPAKDTDDSFEVKSDFTTKNPFDQLKDLEEEPVGTPRPNQPENNVFVVTRKPGSQPDDDSNEDLKNMDDVMLAVANGHKLGLGKHLPRHFRSRLHHAVNHVKKNKDKDCIVSEWSEWTTCTEPCRGETVRMRSIIRTKKGNGRECPPLFEKKDCRDRCRGDGDYMW